MARSRKHVRDYFDEGDGRQLRPLPKKWIDLSRFKVGDKIEYLGDDRVHFPCAECKAKSYFHYSNANRDACEERPMKGQIGVVERVNSGYGTFPSRYMDHVECHVGEHQGWLTVKFPFDNYRDHEGNFQARACLPDDEGERWRKVKSEKKGRLP